MNFLGIGGLELIVVFIIGLLVVGPVRLVEGVRTARKYMTELRRQREELTQMVEEAVDVEGIREHLDQDGLLDDVRDLTSELNDIREDAQSIATDATELKSLARSVVRPSGYSRTAPDPLTPKRSTDASPEASTAETNAETRPEGSGASS
ncbi:MAG: hypothetical protein F4Y88_03790 [Chloroflexi bacterium]|nr:hypothetical protein [Chloroflexota bacterium]